MAGSWPPQGAFLIAEGVVLGEAKTAGSKWSGVVTRMNPETGRREPVRRADGKGFATFTKDSSGEAGDLWRADVRAAALGEFPGREPLEGPVALEVVFVRPRPKSHFGTGRNAAVLKPSAPDWPATAPDTSKLVRAVEDALNKVIWTDDSRVVALRAEKRWGERHETRFRIWSLVHGRRMPSLADVVLRSGDQLALGVANPAAAWTSAGGNSVIWWPAPDPEGDA